MNILMIDTATDIEIVAAVSDNRTCDMTSKVRDSHSVSLFKNIDKALEEVRIDINDIDIIGVGIGPGSFTGIRIAVTTARMLSQILKIPLVGIKTQMVYAASVNASAGDYILAAFDAKKKRVFGALYRKTNNNNRIAEIITPGDYIIETLLQSVDKEKSVYIVGNGSKKYLDTISSYTKNLIYIDDFVPSGTTACKLIEKSFMENRDSFYDFNRVIPFYARKSDAEAARDSRKGS